MKLLITRMLANTGILIVLKIYVSQKDCSCFYGIVYLLPDHACAQFLSTYLKTDWTGFFMHRKFVVIRNKFLNHDKSEITNDVVFI